MKDPNRTWYDVASHVKRTENLDDRGLLMVAMELILLSNLKVRPEVTDFLSEAVAEADKQ